MSQRMSQKSVFHKNSFKKYKTLFKLRQHNFMAIQKKDAIGEASQGNKKSRTLCTTVMTVDQRIRNLNTFLGLSVCDVRLHLFLVFTSSTVLLRVLL